MHNLPKSYIRRFVNSRGYEISRKVKHGFYEPYFDNAIDIILDIGSNIGQFALELRSIGYTRQIFSFEPLSTPHKVLLSKSSKDPFWDVYRRCAIGRESGVAEIYKSQNSVSSSLLQMSSTHLEAEPKSAYTGREKVEVVALDQIFDEVTSNYKRIAIKIDTQGFEMEVLLGLGSSLSKVAIIQLELSVQELYEGQPLHLDFFNFFHNNNFDLRSIKSGFTHPKTGRLLQFDVVFENKNLRNKASA